MPTPPLAFEQTIDRISKGKYVSLTTFRKDGRAVATPMGCVIDNGTLYVMTAPDTGKIKRIRAGSRVTVAPCGMNGTVPQGAPIARGTARLLDEAETARVQGLMVRGAVAFRMVRILDRIRRHQRPLVAIAVTA